MYGTPTCPRKDCKENHMIVERRVVKIDVPVYHCRDCGFEIIAEDEEYERLKAEEDERREKENGRPPIL